MTQSLTKLECASIKEIIGKPCVLYGASFGGYNTLRFATDKDLQGMFNGYIVLNPSFDRTKIEVDRTQTTPDLKKLSKPTLFIIGKNDMRVPPYSIIEHIRNFLQNALPEKNKLLQLVTLEGGHLGCGNELAFEVPPFESEKTGLVEWESDRAKELELKKDDCKKYLAGVIANFINHLDSDKSSLNRFRLQSLEDALQQYGISDSMPLRKNFAVKDIVLRTLLRTYFTLKGENRDLFLKEISMQWVQIPALLAKYKSTMQPKKDAIEQQLNRQVSLKSFFDSPEKFYAFKKMFGLIGAMNEKELERTIPDDIKPLINSLDLTGVTWDFNMLNNLCSKQELYTNFIQSSSAQFTHPMMARFVGWIQSDKEHILQPYWADLPKFIMSRYFANLIKQVKLETKTEIKQEIPDIVYPFIENAYIGIENDIETKSDTYDNFSKEWEQATFQDFAKRIEDSRKSKKLLWESLSSRLLRAKDKS